MDQQYDLIVAGAGIVGVCTALWAQKSGLRVLLVDGNLPGSGTVSGSACTIATYGCLPVNSPTVLKSLPYLMFSKDSPLQLSPFYAATHPRWMLGFLNNCRAPRVAHITQALGGILRHTDAGLDPLIAEAGCDDLMVSNDAIYVYTTKAGFEGSKGGNAMRAQQGVAFDELTPDELHDLEPHLKLPAYRALRFKGVRHVSDPQALVTRLFDRFVALGGTWHMQMAKGADPDVDGVTLRLENGEAPRGTYMALTAGAFSKTVQGTGAKTLPLGVERGYHVLYRNHAAKLSRPVGWAEAGFYATPMADGLRIAGTVEIAALNAPPNPKRTAYLARKAEDMFGPLGAVDQTWLGHRPTLPDSLPVIGTKSGAQRILMGFGHQHIGLTLGGITGRILSEMAQGQAPSLDISDFSPNRF